MTEAPSLPTPRIDIRKQPEPGLRPQGLAGERHTSPEFMAAEWRQIWTRVWQIGCLESELPRNGAFVTHDVGQEPLMFVREGLDEIRRYSVCHHRGNRLAHAGARHSGAYLSHQERRVQYSHQVFDESLEGTR